jgi:hypothetical protein
MCGARPSFFSSACVAPFLMLSIGAYGQPAPARSDGLCTALRQAASDGGFEFKTTYPGACAANIDTGYKLLVDYSEQTLHLGLSVDPVLLNGDASAFWLRLSAFDNLVHSAFGTKQQTVFDEMNRLARKIAQQAVATKTAPSQGVQSRADKATLSVSIGNSGVLILVASAYVKDIDKMKQERSGESDGQIASWRRILGLSLQAFAAGAKGYSDSYQRAHQNAPQQPVQPIYRAPRTCYTNLIGTTAFTNCY